VNVWNDVKYAWRQLLGAPGFSIVAVLTFALGIGATTAIFSAVHAVVLRPFPFPEPDRVVVIGSKFGNGLSGVSPGNFEDWQRHATSFSAFGARQFRSFNVSNGAVPERIQGAGVTSGYFTVFGIAPALGRTFTADEDQPGNERVLLLSHRLWVRLFGADPSIVGRAVGLDGTPHTVIGVMPKVFDELDQAEELWVPAAFDPEAVASHDGHSMLVFARLAPGVSLERAAAEFPVIFSRMKADLPANTQVREGLIATYASETIGDAGTRMLVLLGAVGFVLLIACGNVAHLLLARGRTRSHEVALRASLGAAQTRLIRQFLTEALVLAGLGGAVGVLLAYTAIPVLLALSPDDIPRLDQAQVNGTVLLFAVAATLIGTGISGIVPAMRAARPDLRSEIVGASRSVARGRDAVRASLVAVEVALAIVLLTGAGLLVRSALYLQSVDIGVDGSRVVTARVSLPAAGYRDPAAAERAFTDMVTRLAASAGIEAAAFSSNAPMAPGGSSNGLVPEGKTFDPDDFVLGRLGVVSRDYFRVLGIPLVAGRAFGPEDRAGSPRVMVLSESAARRLFPGEPAVGKRVACCEGGPNGAPILKLVVGVVGDVRTDGPGENARNDFYLPVEQAPVAVWDWFQRTMTLVVRGDRDDAAWLAGVIRTSVNGVDAGLPVHSIATIPERLRAATARDRFNTMLMFLLGAVGLVLAAVGIYGVISCGVGHRRQELAVRLALGATTGQIVRLVLDQGMRPVWAGVVLGVPAALGASTLLADAVHGSTTRDPLAFSAATLLLVAAALLANLIPARTAARVNPARLLGH
jgi:predicted permease